MGNLLKITGCLIFVLSAHAEDLYFTQAGAGTKDGSSLANAWSVTNASTSGNWGSGAGKISAGDTLHVSGTITSIFTVQGSGSAGSPVTIQFESGAKFSAPRWSTAGEGVFSTTQAAIVCNGQSYLTIDGSNSVNAVGIETTDTGTAKTYQDYNIGVLCYGSASGLTFQNLTITNMYRRTPHSSDVNQDGGGIQCRGGTFSNVLITNCEAWQANVGFYLGYASGTTTNYHIRNSRGGDCGEGVFVMGSESASSYLVDWGVHGCTFQDEYTWSGAPDTHCNLIHAHCTAIGAVANLGVIENNTFTGTGSDHMTSFIFFEGALTNLQIRNNLIRPTDTTYTGNGYITIKGSYGVKILNNTLIGTNQGGTAIGTTSNGGGYDGGIVLSNNLVKNFSFGVYDPESAVVASDYNNFSGNANMGRGGAFGDWAHWRATTFDGSGTSSTASLDSNFVPTSGDTVAKDAGVNLSSLFTTDKNGNTRSGAWDIGAFEYQSGGGGGGAVLHVGTLRVGQ